MDLVETAGDVQGCIFVQEGRHHIHIELITLQQDVNDFQVFQLAGNMEWCELGIYC